ncbi:MAG: hypothetical protein WBO30_11575, partial [Ferruginibacter sp.]
MKKIYFLLLTILAAVSSQAQTTLISPTGEGGFENGATFAANGWTVVNGATNQWFVGTVAVPSAGTNSAYISNDVAGATYNYLNSSASTVHFYRDITFPAGETNIVLSFKWKAVGEGNYDYVTVYSMPTSVTPVFNSPAGGSQSWLNIPTAYSGAVVHATPPNLNVQATYQTQTICLPAAYAGTTRRLVFMWSNDGSLGGPQPGSIDEISLVSSIASAPANQPTVLGLTPISTSQIDGSFTAAAGAPDGYLTVRYPAGSATTAPANGTTYTTGSNLGLGKVVSAAAAITFNATGLTANTNYDFYVYAYNSATCGGGPLYRTVTPLTGTQSTPACGGLAGGTYSVGPTGTYTTLTAAIAATSGGITGPVIFELQTTYTSGAETYPITFPANGCTGPVNSITVRPVTGAAGLVITSSNATATVDFNGASYVTIDGRPGGVGVTSQLTIANTATGSAVATRFINDAVNNTVTYCSITGSTTTSFGVVLFSTGTVTGNDNNTISNNNIGPSGANLPLNGIYSLGSSSTIDNSDNIISGNNIFDYFSAASATNGMNINSNNSGWVITNNKLYQTATRRFTTANTHNGINITSGSGYTITGNTIGFANIGGTGTTNLVGNSVDLTGTFPSAYTTIGTANATRYIAISAAFTAGGTVSEIQNNTIAGFALYTSSGAATTNGIWCGINVTSGNVNIGTTTGNTIGATSGNGSVYTACTTTGGAIVGIYASSVNTVVIKNNTIGALDAMGTTASLSGGITGINTAGTSGVITITGNTIGNATNPGLRMGNLTTGGNLSNIGTTFGIASGTCVFQGILNSATGAIIIGTVAEPNIIQNVSQNSTGTSVSFRGINISGGTYAITGNTIKSITSRSANVTTATAGLSGLGILHTGGLTGSVISQNTIFDLELANAVATGTNVSGIGVANTIVDITRNRIYDLRNASTSVSATAPGTASGIFIRSATASTNINIVNNMISLGNGQTSNTSFIGIWANHGSSPNPNDNIYYNSVNIEGVAASGANPSFAFHRGNFATAPVNQVNVDIRNNIFNNTRSGGTGAHYAIGNFFNATTVSAVGWGANASNNNVLNANAATIGHWQTAQTFGGWKTVSVSDAASLSAVAVPFVNTVTADLHLNFGVTPTAIESGGQVIAGIAIDYDNQVRPGPIGSVNGGAFAPDMGADEFDGVYLDIIPPAITYTPLSGTLCATNVTLSAVITDNSGINTTAGTKPRMYFKKSTDANTFAGNTSGDNGWKYVEATNAASPFSFTTNYALLQAPVTGGDIIQYFVVAQDLATPAVVGINSGVFNATPASVNLAAGNFPITGTINSYNIGAGGISGTVTIGAAGTYPTLTGAGGLFADLNAGGLTGNVIANILDATITEPGTNALNQMAYGCGGPFTLTIKPNTGVTAALSNAFSGYLIRILSNNVIIDGSNNGSTSRDLTIENTTTTTPSVLLIGSTGTVPVTNVTVKNSILINGANTNSAVVVSDGTAPGTAGYFNNITIQNNSIQKAYIANYNIAVVAPGNGSGLLITGNDINTAGANSVRLVPVYVQGIDGATISNNNLGNIANTLDAANVTAIWLATGTVNTTISGNNISSISTTSGAPRGIAVSSGAAVTNVVVTGNTINGLTSSSTGTTTGIFLFSTTGDVEISKNKISDIKNTNGTGFGSNGIQLATTLTGANIDVNNNFVWDIAGNGFNGAGLGDNGYGIIVTAGGGYNIDYNTIHLNTEQVSATGRPMAINITSGVTAAGAINLRNNILATNQTTGTNRYAIYSAAASAVFGTIDYNDYSSAGPNLGFIGVDRTTLADIQTGFGGNLNSKNVLPVFVGANDLHLSTAAGANWCLNGTATPLVGITTDIDGDTRHVTTPDMGADEFVAVGSGDIATPASQTVCTGVPITTIVLSGGAASYSWTRDNPGVTGIAASGTGNISGTLVNATASPVTVTFTITALNADNCAAPATFTATVTVNPTNSVTLTSAVGTDAQTVCINTAITNITYSTTGATGATVTGLPAGVTGSWLANVVTISGTPTVSGPFSYTVTLTGGCGTVTATGTITVTANNTVTLTSAAGTNAQTVCINTAITNITYSTTGATGATVTGLPAGVTGAWAANVVTISGTPTASGPFSYTVTLTGGCGTVTATGSITVTPASNATIVYIGSPYCTTSGTATVTQTGTGGGTYSAAPAGLTLNTASGDITLVSSAPGTYTVTYTVAAAGGCPVFTTTTSVTVSSCVGCTWTADAVYPITVLDQATVSVGSNMYAFGGVSTSIIGNAYKFDGASWTAIAPLPVGLEFPAAATDGTNIYVAGGANGSGIPQTSLYRYNVATNTYTTLASFTTGTWNQSLVFLNNKLYKFCGTIASSVSTNVLEIYDIASNTWSLGANYPASLSFVTAVAKGNFIYSAGGIDVVSVATLKTYRYDPAANSWNDAAIADLPQTRWGAAGAIYNNNFIVAGGYVNGNNISNTALNWDLTTNTWSPVVNMLGERARMTGATLGASFHVIGGRSIASPGFVGTNDNQKLTCAPPVYTCAENFDAVMVPALPGAWYASTGMVNGSSTPWVTSNAASSSAPNSAFTNDPGSASDEYLDTRPYALPAAGFSRLYFMNNYALENNFDGMVLEISVNNGAFVDILAAGGTFVTGGYSAALLGNGNPLGTRQAWTGISGGFITTSVNLPASANGQNVIFRFRRGTDNSVSSTGVYIDDVYVIQTATISYAGSPYCSNAGTANVTLTGTSGGTFSAAPAGLSLNTSTGAVDLGASMPGTYTVTYSVSSGGGCPLFTTTASITITALPTATISYPGSPYCSNGGTATVTQTGTAGGTYSSTAGLSINASTGAVDLGASAPGTYTVTYTIAAGSGCPAVPVTTTITITALPTATIAYTGSPYCSNAGTATVTQTGTAGGTYSAVPGGLSISPTTGTVTLGTSVPGT